MNSNQVKMSVETQLVLAGDEGGGDSGGGSGGGSGEAPDPAA